MSALQALETTPKPSPKRTRSARLGLVPDVDGSFVVDGEKLPPSPLAASAAAPRQKKRKRGSVAPARIQKESDMSSPPPRTSSTLSPVPDTAPPSLNPYPVSEKMHITDIPSPTTTVAPSPTIAEPPKDVDANASSLTHPPPPQPIPQPIIVPKETETKPVEVETVQQAENASKNASTVPAQAPPQSEPPPPPTTLQVNPHAFYYYNHGDLLIEVEGVHFKLFWDRITKASAFFQEKYDGAKVDEGRKGLLMAREAVSLAGMGVTVEDMVTLLDMVESIKPPQTQARPSLKTVLSILNASHALQFHGYTDWAKDQLATIWAVGEEFENLDSVTHFSPQDVARSIVVARQCGITAVIKPAVFSLVRLPGFGGSGSASSHSFDLVRCREHLLSHWITTLNRLVFPCCTRSSPSNATNSADADTGSLAVPCTANDPVQSRLFHFKSIYESGLFQLYVNDAISGFQALKEQLVPSQPQTTPPPRKKRRKFSEEPEVKKVPEVGKWADANEGGYCEGCVEKMWDVCAEAVEECWERLDEWAGVATVSGEEAERMDVS